MKNKWTYRDIIDLEYLLFTDSSGNSLSLDDKARRDRDAYSGLMEKGLISASSSDRDLLLAWTRKMAESDSGKMPGTAAMAVWRYLLAAMAFGGVLTGLSIVSAVLYYNGREPVNVAAFLGVTVLPHWIFLLLLGLRSLICFFTEKREGRHYPFLYSGIRKISEIFLKSGLYAIGQGGESLSLWLMKISKVYSSAFFWPILILAQVFGLFTALSSLAFTLMRVAFTDLAFGWQSTLDTAPGKIHAIAALMSSPWSWFLGEGLGFPDSASVAGSRMVLKEGMMSLSTPDLASWWPFLCLCIFFYAFIPRLILLGAGLIKAGRYPGIADLCHAECAHLVLRMRSPLFDTRADEKNGCDKIEIPENDPGSSPPIVYTEEPVAPAEPVEAVASNEHFGIVLVSADFMDLAGEDAIISGVSMFSGKTVSGVICYEPEPFFEKKAIEKLKAMLSGRDSFSVCLIMEAWQPPILEIMDFVKMVRSAAGKKTIISIMLAGKPRSESVFTKPSETDRSIWSSSVARLLDPYILITEFGK